MFITKAKKYRQQDDGTILAYSYYRLTKSFRDSSGKIRKRNVLCLGELDGYSKGEREELADMLTEMIENGQHVISEKASPSTSPTREKARMRRWYPSRGRKTASRLTPLRSSMENMS